MRTRLKWLLLSCATLVVGTVYGTPSSGFTGKTIGLGRFDDINVRLHVPMPVVQDSQENEEEQEFWRSVQQTNGPSDLYIQNNTWAPGGTTGWHSHPGHSLIIVTAGEITAYDGDDPTCSPHVYTAGNGFVDAGGTHVHVLRNEGSVQAQTIAVQLVPAGFTRRIDATGPSTCPF